MAAMANEADCHLLLDVNNVYVTCYNHRLDAQIYLDALPLDRVIQVHLSGHSNKGNHIVDTHDDQVIDEVWNLYKYVVHRAGRVPNTMIEWDDRIPDFSVLFAELDKAKTAAQQASEFILPQLAQAGSVVLDTPDMPLLAAQTQMQQAVTLGSRFDSAPEQWIRAKHAFAPHEQLSVYANAYRYRLYDVVAEDYPVLRHYLTEQVFADLMWAFVAEVLPDHFNIGRFALKLPAFIQQALPDDAFAHDLCQLETTVAQMTDPAETEALNESHLQGLTAESILDLTLYPRQALQLLQFDHQVNAYYQAVMDDEADGLPSKEPVYLAVFRHEDVVWRMPLEANEFVLLSRIFSGATIGEVLADVDESEHHNITAYFSKWMRNGLLASQHDT